MSSFEATTTPPGYTPPSHVTTRPTLRGTVGMVASTHWLASQSAMSVLERGGNAFDAAVACAFVLHLVEPHLNGPGGDLVAIVAPAGEQPRVLAGQAAAPRGASVDSYRAMGLDLVPGAGQLAATAPGAFDAWLLLLRDHGTWELPEVIAPALHYARTGVPVLPAVVRTIDSVAQLFRDAWPTSAAQWMPAGAPPEPNTLHARPDWARTLERLVESSVGGSREQRIDAVRTEWATGFVAQQIDAFIRQPRRDSSGSDHAGVLCAADLGDYRAVWEPTASIDFRGNTIHKAGAWTQGPTLLQALALLDGVDDPACLDPSTPLGAHTVLETMNLVMADRDAWYGDTGEVPLDDLLSPDYARDRRALVADVASADLRPGSPGGRTPRLPAASTGVTTTSRGAAPGAGEPTVARTGAPTTPSVASDGTTNGDTCHLDIVDSHGNMISATPSGGWLQSSPHIPELGFCLGSRLQMTWLEEGLPSSLVPGRRPRTTLSPTLVTRDGAAVLACGTPGGDQQDQWQLPFLLRHLVGGYDLQQAIDAPTLHSTSTPESFWPRERLPAGAVVEDRLGPGVIDDLRERGHDVTVADGWSLGRLSAVANDKGLLSAAANPRGAQGYAVGR